MLEAVVVVVAVTVVVWNETVFVLGLLLGRRCRRRACLWALLLGGPSLGPARAFQDVAHRGGGSSG